MEDTGGNQIKIGSKKEKILKFKFTGNQMQHDFDNILINSLKEFKILVAKDNSYIKIYKENKVHRFSCSKTQQVHLILSPVPHCKTPPNVSKSFMDNKQY